MRLTIRCCASVLSALLLFPGSALTAQQLPGSKDSVGVADAAQLQRIHDLHHLLISSRKSGWVGSDADPAGKWKVLNIAPDSMRYVYKARLYHGQEQLHIWVCEKKPRESSCSTDASVVQLIDGSPKDVTMGAVHPDTPGLMFDAVKARFARAVEVGLRYIMLGP